MSDTKARNRVVSELTLAELFPRTLTDTSCVFVDRDREVWVATEMCAQYLESVVDSIVVTDNGDPLGIVGGYDLLENLKKNPSRNFQYESHVGDIMFSTVPQVQRQTKLADLVAKWNETRRAFAIIGNDDGSYSPISARKMLEVGARCRTDISISTLPKNKMVTFKPDDTLGRILDLMFANKTRKLLLENSNQFISDRLILGEISRILKFQKNIDSFSDIPASDLRFDFVKIITDDMLFDDLCHLMERMEHPYVLYKDVPISPWDVCVTLTSVEITELLSATYQKKCPHCKKELV
jgi:predicted transcriptional regulator